jgi:predicted peptidase
MKRSWLLLDLMIVSMLAVAQEGSPYIKQVYTNEGGDTLIYRMLSPAKTDQHKKYPLIVFLHGAGERGNDNEKQLVHGSSLFIREEIRNQFPAFVIFPQCPEESYWSSVDIDRSVSSLGLSFNYTKPITKPLHLVVELIKGLKKTGKIDSDRVYIMGLSMGGMGTFEAAHRFPNLFAAALPICGGGDAKKYSNKAARVPFWIFHGSADNVVNVRYSQEMRDKLTKLKANVTYTEYPGVGHNSWDNVFAEPDLLPWMFSKHR